MAVADVDRYVPKGSPLDLHAEIHIPADRMSLAWRRALVERFGLGTGRVPMAEKT